MTENHPITPPPELVQQWFAAWESGESEELSFANFVIPRAAQWGADCELDACCEVLNEHNPSAYWGELLRSRRRPKPLSLKEQALAALNEIEDRHAGPTIQEELIRRALEQLDD
jgi:hypothetical protein